MPRAEQKRSRPDERRGLRTGSRVYGYDRGCGSLSPVALQADSAHAAIDAGASVVFGHHPHVLQGIETYNGGVIIYSLGNLIFDFDFVDYSFPGLPSALTGMLNVEVSATGVVSCEFIPMIIAEEDGRPRLVSGAEAAPVLERMQRLSDGSCGL